MTLIERAFAALFLTSGEMFMLLLAALRDSRYVFRKFPAVLAQMVHIGVNTFPLASMIGLFTGMIVALQTGLELQKYGLAQIIGGVVGLSVTRAMGPIITGFIIAARVGAAMTAELGTMAVNEEVDSLRVMNISPSRYLVMPRIVATIIMQPVLTIFSTVIGVWGGSVVATTYLDVPPDIYWNRLQSTVEVYDVFAGLLKAAVFGTVISTVCCHQGLATQGGASGVGRATTSAVVISLTMILVCDYLLTRFLL